MKQSTCLAALAPILFLFSAQAGIANDTLWSDVSEAGLSERGARTVVPTRYRTLALDLPRMAERLAAAPADRGSDGQRPSSEVVMALPHPDGRFVEFRIWRSGVMSTELAARYPQISTYRGAAVDGGERVWLDLTTKGFHAMVRGVEGSWFIDPYWRNSTSSYVSYLRADLHAPDDLPDLQPPVDGPLAEARSGAEPEPQARGDELRTYRLAVAATGEYTQFHGGTVSEGLSAIVTTMNRVTGIYEDELSVSFTLIDDTDKVIYTDGADDPYTNNNGSTMLDENQANLDSVIGTGNYDIGHVFSTGGGGIARLRSVCSSRFKAEGVTGLGSPVGDPFDVDYVSHEIGHQFGGNHTFDNCSNSAGAFPYEPFSGSTIMAYAGICGQNLQFNSDAHFHTHNFDEISAFVGSGGGATCGLVTPLGNSAPTVDAGTGGMTIPAGTPFMLTGSASDVDGDTLRYRWEQHDLRSGNGAPIFRSFPADSEPVRVFPRLSDLLGNTQTIGESLPSGSRTLSFRLTALDDHEGGGGVDYDEISFEVDGGSGPFLVTEPNTAVTWTAGSTETVNWDVAGTDAAPVACTAVDIDLSTDGGQTFDVTVADNAANDGSLAITVPNTPTAQARLRVRCSDNIFFDLSNADFTIEASSDDFSVAVSPAGQTVCVADTASLDVAVGQLGSFAEVVTLSASGQTGSAVFTLNDQVPPFSSELQLGNLAVGNVSVTVTGTASSGTRQDTAELTVSDVPGAPELLSPADDDYLSVLAPQLQWSAVAGSDDYLVEIDDQPDFVSPLLSQAVAGTSFDVPEDLLDSSTPYYWRVTARNICGQQTSPARRFNTAIVSCETFTSSDVPVAIDDGSAVPVYSALAVAASGEIIDVDVIDLTITHSWINDLTISLLGPSSTSVELMSKPCGNEDDILISFDDEAASGTWPCPPTDGGAYQPENGLSAFDGETADGTWQLAVADDADEDIGTIDAWSLAICTARAFVAPLIFDDRFEQ